MWGGINVYGYTPNQVQWIDPLGLAPKPKTPPKPVEHQVCCLCDKGLAYRVKDTHNIQNGIDARDPSANYAMEGHVLHGSKENVKTQYISASRTYAQAVANSAKYGTGKLTKTTKHAKRHFWLNDVCTCHGLLPSHSA